MRIQRVPVAVSQASKETEGAVPSVKKMSSPLLRHLRHTGFESKSVSSLCAPLKCARPSNGYEVLPGLLQQTNRPSARLLLRYQIPAIDVVRLNGAVEKQQPEGPEVLALRFDFPRIISPALVSVPMIGASSFA